MKFYEVVVWYQKKIGTYDKQQWEKTVEQKILNGFNSVALKNAKLKTELIDVDLVRGSTFHKAKPKQSLFTVIRLAVLRYFFLPVYTQWWVHQTTPNAFGVLLFLYITQMINWAIYASNINPLNVASSIGGSSSSVNTIYTNGSTGGNFTKNIHTNVDEQSISVAELLIPMALSLLLSLIHSQIVATNCAGLGLKSNHRRFSNTNTKEHRLPTRLRRRKKFVRIRCQDNNENAINEITQRKLNSYNSRLNSDVEVTERIKSEVSSKNKLSKGIIEDELQGNGFTSERNVTLMPIRTTHTLTHPEVSPEVDRTEFIDSIESYPKIQQVFQAFDEPNDSTKNIADFSTEYFTTNFNRKRNVNWHSPVHNYAVDIKKDQEQTLISSTSIECSSSFRDNNASSSSNIYYSRCVDQVEDPVVQEFFDSIINKAITSAPMSERNITYIHAICPTSPTKIQPPSVGLNEKKILGEDDGFESLNGKSSSGEETNTPMLTAQPEKAEDKKAQTETASEINCRVSYDDSRVRKISRIIKAEQNGAISKSNGTPVFSYRPSRSITSESTDQTDEETCDDTQTVVNSDSITNSPYNECTTSATEWLGVTTNSEEGSCSSDLDNSDDYKKHYTTMSDGNDGYDLDFTPTTILNPQGTAADRISCTIWDQHEAKKAQMSVLEISSSIIERVESMPETNDYIYIGIFFSIILSLVPTFYRLCEITIDSDNRNEISYFDLPMLLWEKASFSFMTIFHFAFGQTSWERAILIVGLIQRLCLTLLLFMIFAVAERSFKQRFLYGKLFSHLTSSRRAKKSNLPHFRLNKVRNIKTWLSVRSYLKKRGPQRSIDIIVSAAFIVTLFLIAFLSVEWLKDSAHLHSHLNLEALMWSTAIGIFVLRFMTLGNKIHHKYRSVSVLITEQINLYLQIEQKPKKKEELMVSNSVLKLAADLLKELESPFKISGLSANPYLFTTIKVVILSALSGMLSEMLGFKLKLHKIKIK